MLDKNKNSLEVGEIKVVTFDVGGTLAKGGFKKKLYRSKVTSYLQRQGFDVTSDDYWRATGKALEELNRRREDQLEMGFEDFCSTIIRNLGITPSEELLGGIRSLYFKCFPQIERRGVRKVLVRLSGAYELGVISNSMSLLPKRFLEESELARYFKAIVISGEVGYRKPHPEIFKRTLEKFEASPEEVVHVGNSLEEDVVGAKGVGMYSVLVSPQVIEEAQVGPDLAVPSIGEVPGAIESLAFPRLREFKELLGNRCGFCSARGVNLYKIDPKGGEDIDNYVLLCSSCRRETLKKRIPRPRKHGKYRAIYRRAWLELHKPKRV